MGYKQLIQSKIQIKLREKKIKEMLTYVVKTLDKEKINYWIDRSGLLSILRKERNLVLISDIDIGVNFASKNRVFDLFKSKKYIIDKFYSFKIKELNYL